jgi:hypothetical protein
MRGLIFLMLGLLAGGLGAYGVAKLPFPIGWVLALILVVFLVAAAIRTTFQAHRRER